MYQHASAPHLAVADIQHVADINAGTKYAESAARHDDGKIDDLATVSATLEKRQRELEDARSEQEQQKKLLDNATSALGSLTEQQKKLLDEVGAIPVMGDSELSAADITAWFESRNVNYQLSGGLSIGDLVKMYLEEGKDEHVRADLAFAQAIIETGSFGHARQQLRGYRRVRQLQG